MAAEAGFERFLGELECPVCLQIPREGPVAVCPVGHLVCKTCRVIVTSCPTCRRQMLPDGTNILANKMIEEIPHPCKYSQFGCEIKERAIELEEHEAKCPERTIKCPYLRCKDEVQIRRYHDHALNSGSGCRSGRFFIDEERCSLFSTRRGEGIEGRIGRDGDWGMKCLEGLLDNFYLHQHYIAAQETFVFYVTMAEDSSTADKYLVKITLKNPNDERKHLANIQNVISMDSAPSDRKAVLASNSVMFVPWRLMRGFLKWTDDGDGNQFSEIITCIDILDA